jgi:hypothetical protein
VGFSVGAEGEFGHRDVATTRSGISAGLGLSLAETGDLGLAERHARRHRVVGRAQRWCAGGGFMMSLMTMPPVRASVVTPNLSSP